MASNYLNCAVRIILEARTGAVPGKATIDKLRPALAAEMGSGAHLFLRAGDCLRRAENGELAPVITQDDRSDDFSASIRRVKPGILRYFLGCFAMIRSLILS
jgi:hypothetical protein